jgi:hypothetical protein
MSYDVRKLEFRNHTKRKNFVRDYSMTIGVPCDSIKFLVHFCI